MIQPRSGLIKRRRMYCHHALSTTKSYKRCEFAATDGLEAITPRILRKKKKVVEAYYLFLVCRMLQGIHYWKNIHSQVQDWLQSVARGSGTGSCFPSDGKERSSTDRKPYLSIPGWNSFKRKVSAGSVSCQEVALMHLLCHHLCLQIYCSKEAVRILWQACQSTSSLTW